MYKFRRLDDSANGLYCLCVKLPLRVLAALLVLGACKSDAAGPATTGPALSLALIDLDAALGRREGRPFIAGEKATITLGVRGGQAPYDVQVTTQVGSPAFASGSTRVEGGVPDGGRETTVGMNLQLGSEVPSGTYQVLVRVSDALGNSAMAVSQTLQVVGAGAELAPPPEGPFQLRVVDVAGRRRLHFYQGEAIHIRAKVPLGETIAVGITADDDRAMMPVQTYEQLDPFTDLPLRVPRLARVGVYQVRFASQEHNSQVPLVVIGRQFRSALKPVLEDLKLLDETGLALKSTLTRGKPLRLEALVGGVKTLADAKLRLRDRAGQIVAHSSLDAVVPADPHPEARTLLTGAWTPVPSLLRGRHVLEVEISEGDEIATLYREVVVQ